MGTRRGGWWRGALRRLGIGPDPDDDQASVHYTRRQQKKLIQSIGRDPLTKQFGRGLCPFCIHLEARWRRETEPEPDGRYVVRVRCSQCQKGLVYPIELD